jgi:hypothetical protein
VLFAVMAVAQSVMLGAWASKLPEAEVESSQSALGEAKDNARITADSGLATLPASMLTDKVGPPPSPKGPDRRGYGGSAAAPQSAPPLQVGLNPNHFYTAKHEEVARETTKRRQAVRMMCPTPTKVLSPLSCSPIGTHLTEKSLLRSIPYSLVVAAYGPSQTGS